MAGKQITIAASSGGRFGSYLALPHCGSGPGVVVLQGVFGVNQEIRRVCDLYAEEGYVAVAPDLFWRIESGIDLSHSESDVREAAALARLFDVDQGVADIGDTVRSLRQMRECNGQIGALGFSLGGRLAYLAAARCEVNAAVAYYGAGIESNLLEAASIRCGLVLHFGAQDRIVTETARREIVKALAARPAVEVYVYPAAGEEFAYPGTEGFCAPAASIAFSRSLGLFRKTIGPRYDLSALWDAHTGYEFGSRDPEQTMATMTSQPYVNHIPTMTGGYGHHSLHRFYREFFIPQVPKDTTVTTLSRTVGSDRVVDEILFSFTHDVHMEWMIPGIPPTGRRVEIPLIAVVQFRGDKIFNEHIYWDQASLLTQLGVLDPKGLPITAVEQARKLTDESLPSNALMRAWKKKQTER